MYTPADGDNWLLAKLNVQITDIGYAQITEHLARVKYHKTVHDENKTHHANVTVFKSP